MHPDKIKHCCGEDINPCEYIQEMRTVMYVYLCVFSGCVYVCVVYVCVCVCFPLCDPMSNNICIISGCSSAVWPLDKWPLNMKATCLFHFSTCFLRN